MANAAGKAQERGGDRWRTLPAAADEAPVVAREVAGDPPDMAFTRNEVMRETLGGRTWRGALANLAGRPLDEVEVRVRFHDRDGRAVGSPLTARAARLAPGADLYMQARLPAAAVGMQIGSLRWTAGGGMVALGPFGRRPFSGAQA